MPTHTSSYVTSALVLDTTTSSYILWRQFKKYNLGKHKGVCKLPVFMGGLHQNRTITDKGVLYDHSRHEVNTTKSTIIRMNCYQFWFQHIWYCPIRYRSFRCPPNPMPLLLMPNPMRQLLTLHWCYATDRIWCRAAIAAWSTPAGSDTSAVGDEQSPKSDDTPTIPPLTLRYQRTIPTADFVVQLAFLLFPQKWKMNGAWRSNQKLLLLPSFLSLCR